MSVRTHRTYRKGRKGYRTNGTRRTKERPTTLYKGRMANDLSHEDATGSLTFPLSLRLLWTNASYLRDCFMYGYEHRGPVRTAVVGSGMDNITYDVSKARKKGDFGYNYCDHLKSQWVNLPYLYCTERTTSTTIVSWARYYRMNTPIFSLEPLRKKRLDVFRERDADFSNRAYRTMLPRLEGDISMINFIWELKDFRKYVKAALDLDRIFHKNSLMLDKARALAKYARGKLPERSGGAKNRHGEKLKSISKLAAEVNLWYQYELKPTMSDLADIANTIAQTAEQAQQRFYDDGKNLQKRHYTEVITDSELGIGTGENYRYGTGTAVTLKRVAESQFTYDYRIRKGMDLIKQYWGLNLGAEEAWNMLPGSFLVDYVLGVSKSLALMRNDKNMSLQQGLYGESAKFVQSQGLHLVSSPRVVSFVVDGEVIIKHDNRATLVAGHHYTWYKRQKCDVNKFGITLPRLKIPSVQQGLNVLSLARCFI